MGTNLLTVRPGAPNTRARRPATLVIEDVQAIAELPNVLASVPEQGATITLRAGNLDHRSSVNGTSADYVVARNWAPASGTFFSAEDEALRHRRRARPDRGARAVPGARRGWASSSWEQHPLPGHGVMTPKGATPWGQGPGRHRVHALHHRQPAHHRAAIPAQRHRGGPDVGQIDDTQGRGKRALLARHGVEDFQIRNMASVIDTVSETQNTLTTVLLGTVAAIAAGGRRHRRDEHHAGVGHRAHPRDRHPYWPPARARRNILQQFLIEALVVSAVAG